MVEFLFGLRLMAEDLDHLLSFHHFLNITVQRPQRFLLPDKIHAAPATDKAYRPYHYCNHDNDQYRQRHA